MQFVINITACPWLTEFSTALFVCFSSQVCASEHTQTALQEWQPSTALTGTRLLHPFPNIWASKCKRFTLSMTTGTLPALLSWSYSSSPWFSWWCWLSCMKCWTVAAAPKTKLWKTWRTSPIPSEQWWTTSGSVRERWCRKHRAPALGELAPLMKPLVPYKWASHVLFSFGLKYPQLQFYLWMWAGIFGKGFPSAKQKDNLLQCYGREKDFCFQMNFCCLYWVTSIEFCLPDRTNVA